MPADYESLFKPEGGEEDSSLIDHRAELDSEVQNVEPPARPPVDASAEPLSDFGAGSMPTAAWAEASAAPPAPQTNIGLPPGPPPTARPPVRSWPGMPAQQPDVATQARVPAPVAAPTDGWGEADPDGTEATAMVSTQMAADVLNRPVPAAPATAQYGDGRTEIVNVWPVTEAMASAPEQTSAATIGNHRAIDALSHVDVKTSVKMPSQRGWRHILYMLTRINLGLSPDEVYEIDLHNRIRRNARDSYQIGVFGLKGGVGKTAVTVVLGSTLAKVRGDRILAIDADPDSGNLADRCGRESAASIGDLLADRNLARYNDIRAYTSMNRSNLEVLASDDYSAARRPFGPEEWDAATKIVSRYYNLVLADCGAGLFHPAARSVLNTISGLVIVASASIDGARQAAVTMDWLRQNGYQHLLGRTCVVINHIVPGKPNVDVDDLVQQFQRHVSPGRVVVLPFDKHVAAGTAIDLDLLGSVFQRRVTELAAALSDDFERLERR